MNVLIVLLAIDIVISIVRIVCNRRLLKEVNNMISELRELT